MINYEILGDKYDAGRIGGYLSYPLMNFWRQTITDEDVLDLCQQAARSGTEGAYLYFHFPYCRAICTYCACFATAAARPEVKYEDYTSVLVREVDRKLGIHAGERVRVGQLHWGGGTPSLLSVSQIEKICERVGRYVEWTSHAVRSIEVYPEESALSDDKLACLKQHGFTEISFGIESFDPRVLKAINRRQNPDSAHRVFEKARAQGFGVHCDLVYGLPFQDHQSFSATIDSVIALQPDRLATFAFLYTPKSIKHQTAIKPEWVPSSLDRIELYRLLEEKMIANGYVRVGVDHFVRGERDPLAQAARDGKIVHHFQGYEPAARETFLGFGSSAISFIGGHYFQNRTSIGEYSRAVKGGALPTGTRSAHRLNQDDKIRANVILQALMCQLHIDKQSFEQKFSIDFDQYFADELEQLAEMEADGIVEGTAGREIRVTAAGRPLLRVVCRVFDRYTKMLLSTKKREASGIGYGGSSRRMA